MSHENKMSELKVFKVMFTKSKTRLNIFINSRSECMIVVVLTVAIAIIVAVNSAGKKKAYFKVIGVMIVNICFNRFTPSKKFDATKTQVGY